MIWQRWTKRADVTWSTLWHLTDVRFGILFGKKQISSPSLAKNSSLTKLISSNGLLVLAAIAVASFDALWEEVVSRCALVSDSESESTEKNGF